MNSRRILSLALSLTLCVSALATFQFLVGDPARAQASTRYVATNGTDSGICTDPSNPCRTVQYAVDAANNEDLIKVATGVYTDVQGRPAPPGYLNPPPSGILTQVVDIGKTVIIRGGYTAPGFAGPPDPIAHPTTLDAQGHGRVFLIGRNISPTIEGLHIAGGDATGQGGRGDGDVGGGGYIDMASATISNCLIYSNTACIGAYTYCFGGGLYLTNSTATLNGNTVQGNAASADTDGLGGYGYGGGLYLYDSDATLSGNTVQDNTASTGPQGHGGGLYLHNSTATLSGNTVQGNTASARTDGWGGYGYGGGLHLYDSDVTLNDNTVQDNTASRAGPGEGGGLYLLASDATLSGNMVQDNTASIAGVGYGGGLYLMVGDVTLTGNTVHGNTACIAGEGNGGGLYLNGSGAKLSGNTVQGNTASTAHRGSGGGLYLSGSDATLSGNTVQGNTASGAGEGYGGGLMLTSSDAMMNGNSVQGNAASSGSNGSGGGLYLMDSQSMLANNFVTDNQADTTGSGLYIEASSPRLWHTIIAQNTGGDGSGVYVTSGLYAHSNVLLTNTILVGQEVGITVLPGNTAGLDATLWGTGTWANGTDWGGDGSITTGTVNIWGDPAFVNPGVGDYHLGLGSAATDTGVEAGVHDDIDNEPRPIGPGHDIGADEAGVVVSKEAVPNRVLPGAPLTFALCVTNVSNIDLHATITDILPAHVITHQPLVWITPLTASGGLWTQTVAVTVDQDYVGPLINLVEVTTDEGAMGTDDVAVRVGWHAYLPLILRHGP